MIMLLCNLDFLSIPNEFSKVEIDIFNKFKIYRGFVENTGNTIANTFKHNDEVKFKTWQLLHVTVKFFQEIS